MDYKQITDLIKLISKSNLTEFKLKQGDLELSLKTDKFMKTSKKDSGKQAILPISPIVGNAQAVESDQAAVPPRQPKEEKKAEEDQQEAKGEFLEIRSPMVGTFYRSPAPDKPPYVKVGDGIAVGSVVCIVEAMKLFNEIESEISGKIVKVLVEDASPVEYDQVLFLVEP